MADVNDTAFFVINLERSPDRLRSAAHQLDIAGLAWQRVAAVDSRAVEDAAQEDNRELFARNIGRDISSSEIALYLSHIKAIESFLASKARFGVIFEDDLAIKDITAFKDVIRELVRRDNRWDIVKLSGTHRFPA